MLGLADIREWIAAMEIAGHHYIGKLDAKQERSIGVYQRQAALSPRMAIGGLSQVSYEIKYISVLVHWNRNARETEEAAAELFAALRTARNVELDEEGNVISEEPGGAETAHRILFTDMACAEPVDVGTDDNGVYERVIWFDVYYEREEN